MCERDKGWLPSQFIERATSTFTLSLSTGMTAPCTGSLGGCYDASIRPPAAGQNSFYSAYSAKPLVEIIKVHRFFARVAAWRFGEHGGRLSLSAASALPSARTRLGDGLRVRPVFKSLREQQLALSVDLHRRAISALLQLLGPRRNGWRFPPWVVAVVVMASSLAVVSTLDNTTAQAAPAFVQAKSSSAWSTASLAFDSNNTAGNLIVAILTFDSGYPRPDVNCSDSKGNVYTTIGEQGLTSGDTQTMAVCYAENIASGANTVSASIGGYAWYAMTIAEYSGVATSNSVDVVASAAAAGASGTDSMSTGSATTTTDGALIIGAFEAAHEPATVSAGSGYNSRSYAISIFLEDKIQSSAGAVTATASPSSSTDGSSMLIAFRPTGSNAQYVAPGDGLLTYGTTATTPRARHYSSSWNGTGATLQAPTGSSGLFYTVRTSPTKKEAIAGYVNSSGTLQVMCFDGTTWTNEWSASTGGTGTTRRFDIAYETNSGDVMVLYGNNNTATTNELNYRTKPGTSACGSGWSSATNLDPVRTSGAVHWVRAAWDRRASSNLITAIWADANSDLSAMVWSGSAWSNEPAAALETSLEVVSTAQDVQDFDVDYESVSGDAMVVWANSAGANGTNGVRYATCTGGVTACTWGSVTTPPTFSDDAHHLDLAANQWTDEMVFASIGDAGDDLQAGYWDGSGWTDTANLDTSAASPGAGQQSVAVGWLRSGGANRSIVMYNDSGASKVSYYVGNVGSFGTANTPSTYTNPLAFNTTQTWYEAQMDPKNPDRLMLGVADNDSDLSMNRVVMSSAAALTWSSADSQAGVEMSLGSKTAFSYAYWRATPSYTQSVYQWRTAADAVQPGSALANQNTQTRQSDTTTALRLRANIGVAEMGLAASSQSFGLQYATSQGGPWTMVTSSAPWCSNGSAPTCNSSWASRRKVTIDNSMSATNLTNFPILVVLNSSNIDYSKTQNNGEDLRFNDADGTQLNYEIEKWNESGNSYVWVRVPQVDLGSKTDYIWMYYDNAAAATGSTTANSQLVWNSNYQAVYHLKESPGGGAGAVKDSTSNGRNLTSAGSMTGSNLGTNQIGDGITFDGVDDNLGSSYTTNLSPYTLEAWASGTVAPNATDRAVIGRNANYGMNFGDSTCLGAGITHQNTGNTWVCAKTTASAANQSYWLAGSWSTTNGISNYLNGSLNATNTTAAAKTANKTDAGGMTLGSSPGGGQYFAGSIDEVRISNIERSADWLRATYLSETNQMNSFGGEEKYAPAWQYLNNATPADGAAVTTDLLGTSTVHGAYVENNGTTTNPNAVRTGAYGEWDFSLTPGSAMTDTTYYFRIVKAESATALTTYSNYGTVNVAPVLNQEAYRWFANNDSVNVAGVLANQDTAASAPMQGTPFRLRTLVHVSGKQYGSGAAGVKLQFATKSGTCDTSFTGENYNDVAAGSGTIRYYNNTTPADGATATSNANDPSAGHTKVMQGYEEANDAAVLANIPAGQDGEWDFSLIDNSAPAGSSFCFRLVQANGTLLDAYTVIPELTTGGLTSLTWTADNQRVSASGTRYNYGFTTGLAGTVSKVTASVPTGTGASNGYLALGGAIGNHASTPDSVASSITGDIDIRVRVALDDWTNGAEQTLVSKYYAGGNQRSYEFGVTAGGNLRLYYASACGGAGASITSTADTGYADGAGGWVRAVLDVDAGSSNHRVYFYTSSDGVSWTPVTTPGAQAGVTSLCDGTASVSIGSRAQDAVNPTKGKIYYAEIRNGIAGSVAVKFDPTQATAASPSTWTSSGTGETWTLSRTGSSAADIEAALTVSANTGIGAGTATVRMIDSLVTYNVTSPAAISSGTAITLGLTGLTNTATAGSYTSSVISYDNSSTPVALEGGTTTSVTMYGLWPVTWSSDNLITSSPSARYTYGATTGTTATVSRVAATVPSGTTCPSRYLALNGSITNGATTPDSAANSITGDIDIRVKAAMDDWTPSNLQVLAAKYDTTTAQRAYMLRITTSGQLDFWWSTDGTNGSSNNTAGALGLTDGSTKWLRATLQVNNGSGSRVVNLYTSDDGSSWTSVYSNTTAGTTSIYNSTSDFQVGYRGGAAQELAGKIYYAEVRNGINGTIANSFDPSIAAAAASPSGWTSASGEAWTITRNGTNLPADIACPLTVSSNSGIGAGTAVVRLIDLAAVYSVTSPASISGNTAVSLGLTGFTNTATAGSYTSTVTTYDNASTPVAVDSGVSNSIGLSTSTWASDSLVTSASAKRYDWNLATGSTATLSKVTASVPAGTSGTNRYADIAGYSGGGGLANYVSTPDSPTNSITSDMEVRLKVNTRDWTPSTTSLIIGKVSGIAGTQKSWNLNVDSSGYLIFGKFSACNGASTDYTSTTPTGITDGTASWIRVTWKQNNGSASETKFYLSSDGSTWNQLGSTVTNANVTAIADCTSPLELASRASGTENQLPTNKYYYAEIRNGIGGTVVNKFDPSEASVLSPSSWTASTGEVWTITRANTLTADLASDLTINTSTGLPAGTAKLRMIDQLAVYTLTTATSVAANTAISLGLTGFTNTPTAGTYTSNVITYNNAGTPVAVDNKTTNSLTFATPVGTAPNAPTSLAQKTTGDVVLSTGAWHNSQNVKFTATATDTDNPDTLYLCVEAKALNAAFTNSEDSCGSGVAYSGSGVTVSHSLTLTDATEYHWQARVKDALGTYSSWVSYDVNAESASDVGIDTTAPTGGTVYDGTSAGVDASFNDGSLSSLSANWSGFSTTVSGLSKYQYSIGTAAGGTQVLGWTDNSTTTSVTATSLSLRTSVTYYVNVRAVDNAGNTSSVVSSNGQQVAPSLTFTVAPSSQVNLFNIVPAGFFTDSQAATLTTSTNGYGGYVVRATASSPLFGATATAIPSFTGGTYALPDTWLSGDTGFGYTSNDTDIQGVNKFQAATCPGGSVKVAPGCYAPFNSTAPGDIVADHTATLGNTPITNEAFQVTYRATTTALQESGRYSTTVAFANTVSY